MSNAQAKLIIWCPGAYEPATVREAAQRILCNLEAGTDDVRQACSLL